MEEIVKYRSYDGNMYDSKEECLKADDIYTTAHDRENFLMNLEKLAFLTLPDLKRHPIGLTCEGYPLFVRKVVTIQRRGVTKKPQDEFLHIDIKVNDENEKYEHLLMTSRGTNIVNDQRFEKPFEECFWNNRDAWVQGLVRIYDEYIAQQRKDVKDFINNTFSFVDKTDYLE